MCSSAISQEEDVHRDHDENEHDPTRISGCSGRVGIVPADRMIQLLVEDAAGPLVRRDYTAKTRVVMSLGYIVNKSGGQKALDFLISGVDPNSWTQRGVRWASPYHATEMDRNRHLSTLAIIGLGLSGNPVAEKVLLSLRQPGTTSIDRQFLSQVDDVVQEALRAHQTIAKEGLSGYYKRSNR